MLKFNYNTRVEYNSKDEETVKNFQEFIKTINREDIGFFNITDDFDYLNKTKEVYEKYSDKKNFVQIGIGGSALGPQVLTQAYSKGNTNFYFLDNIDSEELADILFKINPKESVFYVVSKSGGTAETIACFSIVQNWLRQNGIKDEMFGDYFIFCTDPEGGDLRKYVNEHNYTSLEVPSNIGGRFSILSHVGLLPALFAGLEIDELYKGANKLKSLVLNSDLENNPLTKCAQIIDQLLNKHQVNQTVLMPYSSKLKGLSSWFVQLWAESLGKKKSKNEFVGLTPVPAFGATDQHSQVQLFMEGPKDKLIFMLQVKNRDIDFELENTDEMNASIKLSDFSLNQLMEAEFNGTLKALEENGRDFIHLTIDKNDEEALGQLIIFFESLTALMGHYLKINPFDQPGVELGKKYAYQWLNSLV